MRPLRITEGSASPIPKKQILFSTFLLVCGSFLFIAGFRVEVRRGNLLAGAIHTLIIHTTPTYETRLVKEHPDGNYGFTGYSPWRL